MSVRLFPLPPCAVALSLITLLASGCDCAGERSPRRGAGDGGQQIPDDDGGGEPRDGGPHDECGDGLDDDRDGRVDEDCQCTPGTQQRCFAGDPELAGEGACAWGVQDCASGLEFGTWDLCVGSGAPSDERCNGVDDDCDGETDEGCECPEDAVRPCYSGPAGTAEVGLCANGIERCELIDGGSRWSGECLGESLPATEVCDATFDEDCDGVIDEGCDCSAGDTRSCYGGPAGTRDVGLCRAGTQTCTVTGGIAGWGACVGTTLPSAETCTGGRDEDCDGAIDCADLECDTHAACCTPFDDTVSIVPVDAEILFVVDRSGSMDWLEETGTQTRWQALTTAMNAVLPSITDLPLGMLTFPLRDPAGGNELRSCMVAASPEIPIAVGTGSTISARLVYADPRAGDTPTPAAIATARSYLAANPSTRPRFVVLATDGLPEPNCGATVASTVSAITSLRVDLGVETFVLGFVGPDGSGSAAGIPALRDALNMMADAGGRPRMGAGTLRYYEAVDAPAFERALRAILAAATDCAVDLSSAPPRPGSVVVRRDAVVVPASGYTLTGTRLELLGTHCDAIRSGAVSTISVTDSCGG
ncbi:vWA domain-containing protein [Sandaracinus amylolyticus]|uniref:vWA domain-containing protein n=1 Tax=Sandaracinus amylolyticus TaxID=927083 RepID=UPI001F219E75|nr:vWA domain-containing protein [Sandaracinus amylolyticus]UJR86170.1 Hypothetical protein I5071_82520 [Sandaracinus amylolyticus]